MTSDRYDRGWQTLKNINGRNGQKILEILNEICPDLARYIIEYPYGDIWSRPGLDLKTREFITIASRTTLGYAQPQLKTHIQNALQIGCTKEEIIEVILQMSVYAGFPATLNAMFAADKAFKETGQT